MRDPEIEMKSKLLAAGADLLSGRTLPLTVMVFHEEGFKCIQSTSTDALLAVQMYLERHKTKAYGLLFDGTYDKGEGVQGECLTAVIVTSDGRAKVSATAYVRGESGIDLKDEEPVMLDEPFLHLFDRVYQPRQNMGPIYDMVEHIESQPIEVYKGFTYAANSEIFSRQF